MTRLRRASRRALLALVAAASVAHAGAIDWDAAHGEDVIEILTVDPDGAPRETKVWIATLDDRGFVRTNDSRWFQNLVRDPAVAIRFGGADHPVRAAVIGDPALRARVDARFAEKYPLSTRFMRFFGRTGGKNCIELTER